MLLKVKVRFVKMHAARLCACGLCGCVFAAQASVTATDYQPMPFEHYQPILDRMPFGALPTGFGQAPAAVPTQTEAQLQAQQQKLAKQVNLSCINVTPDGATAIGFTDLDAKPPVNYYLLVGATAGGWTVVKADYDAEWGQIEKDGVTITLQLGKGLIDEQALQALIAHTEGAAPNKPAVPPAAPTSSAPPAAAIPAPVKSLPLGLVRRSSLDGKPAQNVPGLQNSRAEAEQVRSDIKKLSNEGGDIKSYMERFRERKAREKADQEAAEQATNEKLQELAQKITKEELKNHENETTLSHNGQDAVTDAGAEAPVDEDAAPKSPDVPAQ